MTELVRAITVDRYGSYRSSYGQCIRRISHRDVMAVCMLH